MNDKLKTDRKFYKSIGYRILKVGEIIKQTDSFIHRDIEHKLSDKNSPLGVSGMVSNDSANTGCPVQSDFGCYYLRKIEPKAPPKAAKVYYKVVYNSGYHLRSARCGGISNSITYIPNQWVYSHGDSRLFVFDDLEEAKKFIGTPSYGEEIWECKIQGGIKGYGCNSIIKIPEFWNTFNKYAKNRHISKKWGKIWEKFPKCENPAVLAKKVKLLRKVS